MYTESTVQTWDLGMKTVEGSETTTVRVKCSTKELLENEGKKGETYDELILRLIQANDELKKLKVSLVGRQRVLLDLAEKQVTLTDEDQLNVKKWLTATSMMIEAKFRTPYSQSELDTAEKLTKQEN